MGRLPGMGQLPAMLRLLAILRRWHIVAGWTIGFGNRIMEPGSRIPNLVDLPPIGQVFQLPQALRWIAFCQSQGDSLTHPLCHQGCGNRFKIVSLAIISFKVI